MTTLHSLTDRARVPPEQMTSRARAYLAIATARHLLTAVACWALVGMFKSTSFTQIRSMAPFWAWGIIFCIAGCVCGAAALLGKADLARFGLIVSVVVTAAWAGGFIAAAVHGQLAGPVGIIAFVALAGKDIVQCEQPMRSPFEPLVRQVLARVADRERET